MAEGTLFNPGYIGGNFIWWIGQIADDSSWRINNTESKFKSPDLEDQPSDEPGEPPIGWGYRYKVRIIGSHDEDEAIVPTDQLPWAQVMYSVWGGGHGGTFQTPGLKQGMFVFGFYIDGVDQQQPVIMGVLGNNSKTILERKTATSGGINFGPQSFYSKQESEEAPEQKKLKDSSLNSEKTENSNLQNESSDATHQFSAADKKKNEVLNKKHALACPDPEHKSAIKNMKVETEVLSENIRQMQESMQSLESAGSLPIVDAAKDIDAEIQRASKQMAKHMKDIMGKVQQYTTDQFNEKTAPMLNLAVPSFKNKLMEDQIAGLEKLACLFNGLAGAALAAGIAAALMKAFKRKKKQSEDAAANAAIAEGGVQGVDPSETIAPTNQLDSDVAPPLPPAGFYSPEPLCSTEELVGEILGQNINTIMSGFDSAIGPVVSGVKESLGGSTTEEGSEGVGSLNNSVNEENVLAALGSGALIGAMTQTIAEGSSSDSLTPNLVGSAINSFMGGRYGEGLTNLLDLAGVNSLVNQGAIANAISMVAGGDMIGGFGAVSGILGVDASLMQGVGGAFGAIKSGDIKGLIGAAGALGAFNPSILSSIVGKGAALAGPDLGSLTGALGSMGGLNFDIATSIGFIKSVTQVFDCDPPPACSPNDVHTMQGGGSDGGKPSTASVAKSATDTVNKTGTNKSFGTGIEKTALIKEGTKVVKKFKKPVRSAEDAEAEELISNIQIGDEDGTTTTTQGNVTTTTTTTTTQESVLLRGGEIVEGTGSMSQENAIKNSEILRLRKLQSQTTRNSKEWKDLRNQINELRR